MSTYNEKLEWVKASIDSILNQSYSEIEFIIILDNPKNKLLENLLHEYQKKDNRVKIITNKKNMGLVKSLNVALTHCTGKYVARMDADDISIKNRLFLEKKYLEEKNLDFVFSGTTIIDENGNILYEGNNNELSFLETNKLFRKGNISKHPTWFLKREVYEKLNGYREVPYCEDFDFSLRCLSAGYKIGKINKNILYYRIRNTSISRSYSLEQYLNSRGILQLYNKQELEDFNRVFQVVKKSKDLSNDTENGKFILADKQYNTSVRLIKSGNTVCGIINILKSIFISKFYLLKYIDLIKYKIKQIGLGKKANF